MRIETVGAAVLIVIGVVIVATARRVGEFTGTKLPKPLLHPLAKTPDRQRIVWIIVGCGTVVIGILGLIAPDGF